MLGAVPPKDVIVKFGRKAFVQSEGNVKADDACKYGVFLVESGVEWKSFDQSNLVAGSAELGDALGAGTTGADIENFSRMSEKLRDVSFKMFNSSGFLHGVCPFLLYDR